MEREIPTREVQIPTLADPDAEDFDPLDDIQIAYGCNTDADCYVSGKELLAWLASHHPEAVPGLKDAFAVLEEHSWEYHPETHEPLKFGL